LAGKQQFWHIEKTCGLQTLQLTYRNKILGKYAICWFAKSAVAGNLRDAVQFLRCFALQMYTWSKGALMMTMTMKTMDLAIHFIVITDSSLSDINALQRHAIQYLSKSKYF